jgi:sarcosine oxidase/L-pipecolate oxidase
MKDERIVTQHEIKHLQEFLTESIPPLANVSVVYTRCCLYCDTSDEKFWIDRHPEISGLSVASGGSGHAFKFASLLGKWVADVLEEKPNPDLARFRWRVLTNGTIGTESSRHREPL